MGTMAYGPLKHFSFGKRHPVFCSHTSMVRVFLRSTDSITCQTCKRPNHLGWVYVCTVDQDNAVADAAAEEREREKMVGMNGDANASATTADVPGSPSAAKNAEDKVELSPWIAKDVGNGHYTNEQTEILKAQRAEVTDLVALQRLKERKHRETEPDSSNTLRKSTSLLNLKDGTKRIGTKLKRAWKASTEMLKKPTYDGLCTMQRCHHCYPVGGERTWQSLDEICSPAYDKPIVPSSIYDIPDDQVPRIDISKILDDRDNGINGYKDVYDPRDASQTSRSESWGSVKSVTTIRNPNYNHGDDDPARYYENYDPQNVLYWSTMPCVGDDVANLDDVPSDVTEEDVETPQDPYEPHLSAESNGASLSSEAMRSIDAILVYDQDNSENVKDNTAEEGAKSKPGNSSVMDGQPSNPVSEQQNSAHGGAKNEYEQELSNTMDEFVEDSSVQEDQFSLPSDLRRWFWSEASDNSSSLNADTDTDTDHGDESGDDSGDKGAGCLGGLSADFAASHGEPKLDAVGNGEGDSTDKDTATAVTDANDSRKRHDQDKAGIGTVPETDGTEAAYEEESCALLDCAGESACNAESNGEPNTESDTERNAELNAEDEGTSQLEPKTDPEPEPFIVPNIIVTDYDEEQAVAEATAAAKRLEIDLLAAFVRFQSNRQYLGPPVRLNSSYASYPFASASSSMSTNFAPSYSFASPSFASSSFASPSFASSSFAPSSSPVTSPYSAPTSSYSSPSLAPRYYSTAPSFAPHSTSLASSSATLTPPQLFASNPSSFIPSPSTPHASSSSSRIPRRRKADKVLNPKDRTELHAIQEGKADANGSENHNRSFGANTTNGAKSRTRYRPCAGWMPGESPRAGTVPRAGMSVEAGGAAGPSSRRRPAFTRWGGRASANGAGNAGDSRDNVHELFPRNGMRIEMKTEIEMESENDTTKRKGKERERGHGWKGKGKENEGK